MGAIRLEEFSGRWLLLSSHPADFTPVCSTEFLRFSQLQEKLLENNVELLGLSIHSVFSHLAPIKNMEDEFAAKNKFPVIADLDKKAAAPFGMNMPGESKTEASRGVLVIAPYGILRAIIR